MDRYASVMAIESPTKDDDEQWLAYWILYSFLTLSEMLLQPLLEWLLYFSSNYLFHNDNLFITTIDVLFYGSGFRIPIWYTVKLLLVSWLVLPQFRGAAFIYERFVRDKIRKYAVKHHKVVNAKGKIK